MSKTRSAEFQEPRTIRSALPLFPDLRFLWPTSIIAIVYAVHHLCFYSVWLVVVSIAAFLALFKLRTYPLKVQDRVIRLEERLRLQALAPDGMAHADLPAH